jgi:hypothetical protein
MNLNLDFSAVTRFLRGTLNDLRQKHILPVAAVLLVAIIAVPILLSSSPSSPSQPQTPAPVPPPPSSSTLPALNVQSTPGHSVLVGKSRNPFAAAAGSGAATTSTTAPNLGSVSSVATAAHSAVNALNSATASSAASSAGSTTGGSSSTSSSSAGSSSGGSGSSSSSSNPPSITGNSKPKPAPSGLSSTQAYQVSFSETNGDGVVAVDSVKRLSGIPSENQPLLRELGVEQGGNRVLFAVEPGAQLYGPGSCTPGPLDCEILSLAQDQTEAVGSRVGTIGSSVQAEFAVTGITAAKYSSSAAADKARRAESAAGRAALADSDLSALSLFQYEPALGYVIDLRNLTVGG